MLQLWSKLGMPEGEQRAMAIERLGVIGAGTMGAGIAQTALVAGIAVTLVDVDAGQLARRRRRSRAGSTGCSHVNGST